MRWCLFECPNVTSVSVRAIAEANPSLERLVVGREEPMTDADAGFGGPQPIDAPTMVELARRCARIRLLRLRAVQSALNDGGIQALVSSGAPLTTLDLANCDVPSEIGKMFAVLAGTLCDVSLAGITRLALCIHVLKFCQRSKFACVCVCVCVCVTVVFVLTPLVINYPSQHAHVSETA